ncbi:unnamed protein product [Meloidogyne enterolobii]|uniref:Uncharacterized protein n=2 Tax=Meloidogyne enterolobii TaxID=390850 RepID=A0A6V7Y7G6_MELEN|nr:unnamed protein product [Meloidogyne enterolobii]
MVVVNFQKQTLTINDIWSSNHYQCYNDVLGRFAVEVILPGNL